MKKIPFIVIGLGFLSACSSVIEGTSQELTVNTSPPGADCSLERKGVSIARINPTPGAATIKKTKYDITVRCNKAGYRETTLLNPSGATSATFGNILEGGVVGWFVDSLDGADNKYETPINITLISQ
jgi:hypothetical protein